MRSGVWNSFVFAMQPVLILAALLALCWWGLRLWRRHRHADAPGAGGTLPHDAPGPSRTARLAETIAMASLSLIVYALIATEPHTNGLMLRLDALSPAVAQRQIVAATVSGLAVVMLLLLAAAGRAALAVLMLAVVLAGYGFALNGIEWASPPRGTSEQESTGPVQYSIHLRDTNVTGADIWVNEIYLGKMPVRMTLAEFHAKVPYMADAPQAEPLVETRHFPTRTSEHERSPWTRFRVPSLSGSGTSRDLRDYYARVELDGEPAHPGGGSGTGGSDHWSSRIRVTFPQRQQRLESLLDQARLADYQPSAAWFQAMATYDEDGWLAVRDAADHEPAMLQTLDAWARWRYDLDKVSDAASAWAVFQEIIDEARRQQQYFTADVAGRAVELLAPKLDAAQLADVATPLLRNTGSIQTIMFEMNGRPQFGMTRRDDWPSVGRNRARSTYVGRGGGEQLTVEGHIIAHAVWVLDQHLDKVGSENPLEDRLTPELIRIAYGTSYNEPPLRMALRLGGDAIEQFLLRMAARVDLGSEDWEDRIRLGFANNVNRWLYLAAHLHGPAGDQFRQQHDDLIRDMTDRIVSGSTTDDALAPEYLFVDLHRGAQSMAMQYWPRFRTIQLAKESRYDELNHAWDYLVRMDPLSTVTMYVDAWRTFPGDDSQKVEALELLRPLPRSKRTDIAQALRDEVEASPSGQYPDYMLRSLDAVNGRPGEFEAQRLLRELEAGKIPKRDHEHIIRWLLHEAPNHPLIFMLAEASVPELRCLAVEPLAVNPTPDRRAILRRLARDPDRDVQTQAAAALQRLADLAARESGAPGT